MERLSKFNKGAKGWNYLLSIMTSHVKNYDPVDKYIKSLENDIEIGFGQHMGIEKLIIHLGREGLTKMYKTIYNLYQLAKYNGYKLDLHDGNFMMDSDGNPVITDPFWVYDWGI